MRQIKEIYNDVMDWFIETGHDIGRNNIGFNNHTGDSQMFSNEFCIFMFNSLLTIITNTRLVTNDQINSISKAYIFDSGWWGLTPSQLDELKEIENGGYTKGEPVVSNTIINVDKSGNAYKPIFNGGQIYKSNEYISINGRRPEYYYDTPQLVDFKSVKDGLFFDPSVFLMETEQQVLDWFEQYDAILIELLNLSNYKVSVEDFVNIPDLYIYESPDFNTLTNSKYEATASYLVQDWFDDEQGTSGQIVKQIGSYIRFSPLNSVSYECFSENLKVKHDDGEGGYIDVIYSKTDNGVTFGDSLGAIQALAVSSFPPVLSNATLSYSHSPVEYEVLDSDYIGGVLSGSVNGEAVVKAPSSEDLYDEYNSLLRTSVTSQYSIKTYGLDINTAGDELWNRDVVNFEDLTKEPLKVIDVVALRDESFDYNISVPSFPANGSWSGDVFFKTISDYVVSSKYQKFALQGPQ